ncbi:MAG TPA: VOC family protein [Pyrinomonadaceae bacterium]|nr:VOC family protein [Pyrinomonadaceae bacterium]
MIQKMSHATVYVIDQQEALEFYRDKLGFEVRTDATMDGGFRWLTVGPKTQPDFEIALMEPKAGFMYDQETADQIRALVKKGALGTGVFNTSDCRATYEQLKSAGVEFMSSPTERPYGIEALFKDNSGNLFSLTQHKED